MAEPPLLQNPWELFADVNDLASVDLNPANSLPVPFGLLFVQLQPGDQFVCPTTETDTGNPAWHHLIYFGNDPTSGQPYVFHFSGPTKDSATWKYDSILTATATVSGGTECRIIRYQNDTLNNRAITLQRAAFLLTRNDRYHLVLRNCEDLAT